MGSSEGPSVQFTVISKRIAFYSCENNCWELNAFFLEIIKKTFLFFETNEIFEELQNIIGDRREHVNDLTEN